jgi:hypothetical protein
MVQWTITSGKLRPSEHLPDDHRLIENSNLNLHRARGDLWLHILKKEQVRRVFTQDIAIATQTSFF